MRNSRVAKVHRRTFFALRAGVARRFPALLLISTLALSLVGCRFFAPPAGPKARPPIPRAEKIPKVFELHGDRRVDDYYWLRERENPKVLAYLKQENDYAEALLEHTRELQERLNEEFVARLQETDETVPLPHGGYFYYTRVVEGDEYPIHCRKRGGLDGAEERLLDENELAKGHEYFALGAFDVSPNHERLAYSVDTSGAERYTLRIKDLKTGRTFDEKIPGTSELVAWAADNETLFYVTLDAASRAYKAFRHKVGTDVKDDVVVHEEPDEAYFVAVSNTNSKAFVLLELESNTTREIRFLPADQPSGTFTLIHPRQQGLQYVVEHHGEKFFILTNDGAKNFKLVEVPVVTPAKEHWRDVVAERAAVKLEALDVFAGHLVLTARSGGVPQFEVRDLKSGETHTVSFDEPSYTLEAGPYAEFETKILRFSYDSFLTPLSVYDYDLVNRTRELKKRDKVLGGYDPTKYETKRELATAKDGTQIPISLVYRKGLARDGKNPCLLEGYGAYGLSSDPIFNSDVLSLLDRGFVVGLAHVRGGGELGRAWYDDGKLQNKKHTFTDFIACAEYLIAEKYTSPERLAIKGGSAGGLLVGAVMNMRPELFRAVVADVPFVDVLNTMLDPTLPLTVTEYEEWGNPTVKADYDVLRSYSPYDNIVAQRYPRLLALASLNDTRVAYWEPAKWVAKLRAMKTDDDLILLKTNLTAGHGGGSGRYEVIEQRAVEYAFLLDSLGVK